MFEKIPYDIFNATDLSLHEKAMLICVRQFFNHGLLQTIYSIKDIENHLGLSYNTVYKQYNGLKNNGYIETRKKNRALLSADFLTDKINWLYSYKKENKDEGNKSTFIMG
ncbi:helix-turn-helix domain-containing protein [Pedobacter sp. P351]|uniref:helix-turn-helix domain-containing protein n=1 Tax=Pedobacter superstes TaxID=3133441 RepID=UPI0030A79387